MYKRTFFLAFPIFALILFIYRAWFTGGAIIGGDWPYYFPEAVRAMTFPPPLFAFWQNNGLGGIDSVRGLHAFESFIAVVGTQWLGLPWSVVYKFGWFGLFLILSFVSSVVLWRGVFPRVSSAWPAALAGLIYTTNTYILMVTGGGQMGVALSYSLAPIVLASFINLIIPNPKQIQNPKFKIQASLIAGVLFGFQIMIDPRIAYVTMAGVAVYTIFNFQFSIFNFFRSIVVPFIIALGINAFWMVPMMLLRYNPLSSSGDALTLADSLKFFSFADFSHALSLLHPNWPENLFGKTYFLQPEFLVLPILAFASLLFLRQRTDSREQIAENRQHIVFFVFLSLAGAFLAKGANEPFGGVYVWLFEHVPGFVMFRDPTKWYVLTAISYSILIPFSLEGVVDWFTWGADSKKQRADSK